MLMAGPVPDSRGADRALRAPRSIRVYFTPTGQRASPRSSIPPQPWPMSMSAPGPTPSWAAPDGSAACVPDLAASGIFPDRKHPFTLQRGTAPVRQPWHTGRTSIDGGRRGRVPTGVGRVRVPRSVFRAGYCIDRDQRWKNLLGPSGYRLLVDLGQLAGHGFKATVAGVKPLSQDPRWERRQHRQPPTCDDTDLQSGFPVRIRCPRNGRRT
jgi:hypothetical protein